MNITDDRLQTDRHTDGRRHNSERERERSLINWLAYMSVYSSVRTLAVAFLDRFSDVRTPKSKKEFFGVNVAPPFSPFCPSPSPKPPF